MEVQAGVVESFSLQLFSFLSADASPSSSGSILLCRVIIMIATRALVFGVCFLFVATQVRGLTTPSPAKLTTPIRPNNNNSPPSPSLILPYPTLDSYVASCERLGELPHTHTHTHTLAFGCISFVVDGGGWSKREVGI